MNAQSPSRAEDDTAHFRARIRPDWTYSEASAAARSLSKRRKAGARSTTRVRVAVLGTTTTTQLTALLDLFLFSHNLDADIYEAPYGLLRQEILDPTSDLYKFAPDYIFLATTRRDLGPAPPASATPADAENAAAEVVNEWRSLWQTAHERLGCQIIQNNFDAPAWRSYGNLEASLPAAPGQFMGTVNRALVAAAPRWVSIHDLDGLAASVGRWNWGDERFFHIAKLPCSPENLVPYAHGVAALIAARAGRSRKCLVLDLDNTLWGGVIGDDGLAGIALGQGDGAGEAFVAFQRYAKSLRDRGVILAVCSKNEDRNAREPFEKHPEMVLKLTDIACFVANWDDKAANIRHIAKELNIGLDSLVFFDDNPAERAIVRDLVPEVAVPEAPVDPADYVRVLDQHRYFEAISLSAEDLQRTEYYRANAERAQIATNVGDIQEFLRSLDMKAWIGPIGDMEMERSVQLIGKSNQFNLTTQRYSAADIQRMLESPDWDTRVVKLADKFGDNGLISVVLTKAQDDSLFVDTWLMSCRVLKRGVEHLLLNDLAGIAKARGLRRIVGEFRPTPKNDLVRDHYRGLGFSLIEEGADGRTTWELAIDDSWTPQTHFILVEPA